MRAAEVLDRAARDVPAKELDEALASGYGIFGGRDTRWARLRFSPVRARWVAAEQWHPDQRAHFEADGAYVLEVPYSDDRELVMDILKFGPDVEVLEPPGLRQRVRQLLGEALQRYSRGARFADLLEAAKRERAPSQE